LPQKPPLVADPVIVVLSSPISMLAAAVPPSEAPEFT
jgi:hypothetical protein